MNTTTSSSGTPLVIIEFYWNWWNGEEIRKILHNFFKFSHSFCSDEVLLLKNIRFLFSSSLRIKKSYHFNYGDPIIVSLAFAGNGSIQWPPCSLKSLGCSRFSHWRLDRQSKMRWEVLQYHFVSQSDWCLHHAQLQGKEAAEEEQIPPMDASSRSIHLVMPGFSMSIVHFPQWDFCTATSTCHSKDKRSSSKQPAICNSNNTITGSRSMASPSKPLLHYGPDLRSVEPRVFSASAGGISQTQQ